MLSRALTVALGGGLGAALRYLLNVLAARSLPPGFPYATFVVNVSGCFAIGLLAALAEPRGLERGLLGPGARLFLLTGVLGGYTTFSTFGYETLLLGRAGQPGLALVNVAGQVVLGLLAVWAGGLASRLFT
jgi:CrcB protein